MINKFPDLLASIEDTGTSITGDSITDKDILVSVEDARPVSQVT